MWRSVFEMITSRSPAFFARCSAGIVSGNGCQALHRALEGSPSLLVPAVAALGDPGRAATRVEHLAVGAVVALDALELDLLPALAQLPAGARVEVAVAAREVVQERGGAALPVDEGAVAVEGGDFDRWHGAYT